MTRFNPKRLVVARRRRGLKKTELARMIGVAPRSVQAYELGESEPSPETLVQLVRALDFPAEFFAGGDLPELSPSVASFRALKRMTSGQRDSVLAAGVLALELHKYLDERFDLPTVRLPDLRDEDPERAAAALRAEWKLGTRPLPNLVHVLEANGVRVFSLVEDCKEVDAFSFWRDGVPFVFLNMLKSGERGRFDAAHELGHLVLHRHGPPAGRELEVEADRFASAFLMPRAAIVATAPRVPSLDRLRVLKREWKVSVAALARRLYDLGIISQWHYEQACIEISTRGWRSKEPDGIPRETSQLLQRVFSILRDEGTSLRDVARALSVSARDLEALVFQLVLLQIRGGRPATDEQGQRRGTLKLLS